MLRPRRWTLRDRRSTLTAPLGAGLVAVVLGLAACSSPARPATFSNGLPTVGPSAPWSTSASPSGPAVAIQSAPPSTKPAKPSPTKPRPPAQVGTPGVFVFPVVGHYTYERSHHDYPATDILAPCGSQVRAATSGVILEVTLVDKWKASVNAGATRGGLSVSIKGDDGVRYYGSHFESINKNIRPGVRVTAGEALGKVGETGDASACHLHFGLSPICRGTGDWWIQRGVIWPWPYLDSWRGGGHKSPVAEIASWFKKNGCPTHPLVDP
jgi:peptidoglycan LD-endopeptidase LytH